MRPARVSADCCSRFDRGRAEKQKVAIALALTTPLVDQATESLEDAGKPVDLVEYDQPLCVL
jgi:ribosomal protein S12 methylthiotransferase accessory factor YcaO